MKRMSVGCHCLTWGNSAFVQAIDDISSLGYKGIEALGGIVDVWENRLGEFKDALARRRLRLASLYCGGALTAPAESKTEIEAAVRCARFVHANGGNVVVIRGGRAQKGQDLADAWNVFIGAAEEIGRRCLEFGVRAAYHPHRGTMVETPAQLRRLMGNSNPDLLFLAPDTGHLRLGGASPEEVFQTYADRIVHVHFKDLRIRATAPGPNGGPSAQANPPQASPPILFAEIGEGPLNFRAVTKVLRNKDYSGWVIVELDRSARTPRESARISMRYMTHVLGFAA